MRRSATLADWIAMFASILETCVGAPNYMRFESMHSLIGPTEVPDSPLHRFFQIVRVPHPPAEADNAVAVRNERLSSALV